MRLQHMETSLQTQAQEHSKKIEELHKEQNKVRVEPEDGAGEGQG